MLTLGVYGEQAEIAAYRDMVAAYNAKAKATEVRLQTWPDRDAIIDALEAGKEAGRRPPDLFLISRRDLARVEEAELNQPLFDLLDERGVSYGDRYSRDAVESFSSNDDLQCMPYSVSPMVIYYNTDLIDFERMRERDLPVPDEPAEGWSFEEFRAAAEFATRPRLGSRGVHIEPTLRSLAPFVWSGGGALFNDDAEPTSLTFSEDDDRDALTTALEVLRDPRLTLTDRQLERATPLEWFTRGKLGMMEGFRNLTPRAARRARPALRRDADAHARRPGHHRRHHRACASPADATRSRPPTSWCTPSPTTARRRWPRRATSCRSTRPSRAPRRSSSPTASRRPRACSTSASATCGCRR